MTAPNTFDAWRKGAPSYWQQTLPPEELPVAGPLPSHVRFAIVGAGVTGAATALELVQRGVNPDEIALIDGARAAFGASGRNGGFVLSYPGPELLDWAAHFGEAACLELIRLNIRSRELLRASVQDLGLPHQPGGSYYAAASPTESQRVKQSLELLQRAGGTGYALLDHLPGPSNDYLTTLFQPRDVGIHPARYVAALIRRSGVRLVENCPVDARSMRAHASGVAIETPMGTLRADTVVLAANAYLPLFFDEFGTFPIKPARNQVVVLRLEGESTNALWGDATYYVNEGYDYFRQFPDGLMLVGGGRNIDLHGEETWALEPHDKILGYLEGTLAPKLAAGRRLQRVAAWQGIMGMSPDCIPIVGRLAGASGRVLVAGGFTGYGNGFHRVVAERLATSLLGAGEDFGPFRAGRLLNPK